MKLDRAVQMLRSYAGMSHKENDNQGRPKLDQAIETVLKELEKNEKRIECYDLRCKYCNDDNICTNKKVELNFVGINTQSQGFKELLECTKYEPSELYIKTIELLDKIKKDEKDE